MRPRPPSWDPSSVTCDSGAGPSPAHGPTSAAAEAPSRPRGSAPAPRSRPICKYEGPAANDWPGWARPAAPQPVSARAGGPGATPTVAQPLAGAAGAFLSARRPRGGAATCRAGPGALCCCLAGRSPADSVGWYDPRRSPLPPRGGRHLPGNPRGSAHVAWAGTEEGPRPGDARTARAAPAGSGAVWRAGRGLQLRQVCLATLAAGPGDPRYLPWDMSARKARSLESGARGAALKGINQENGLFQTWSYRLLSGTPRWQPWDIGPWPPSLHIQTPNRAERCLLPFCSWHGSS